MEHACEMSGKENIQRRPNLSILALTSFIASFAVARIFTSLFPKTVWEVSGLHVHHFWYGLAMLAIGGWLGISYENERINRLSAIVFGAGGGLIGDEVGLLLTMNDYWTEITYTLIIIFLTAVSMLILLFRYSKIIRTEFAQFLRSNSSLYFGVFLVAVSVAFILETDDIIVITVSSVLTTVACTIVLAYFIQRLMRKHKNQTS